MTLIVALVDEDGDIWMGGDGSHTMHNSSWRLHFSTPKVFLKEGVAFGTCGRHGLSEDILHKFMMPSCPWSDSHQRARAIAGGLRAFFTAQENSHCLDEDGDLDGSVLFGFSGGGLFTLDPLFSMGTLALPFHAIGGASFLGIGSLATSERFDLHPQERLKMALDIGSEHNADVDPPFTIINTKGT